FQSFHIARNIVKEYEVMCWIKKGLGFEGK
ncbi:unnamed protein product, partial [Commensalibacter papalotli (ex Botero et al. 2024)]